MADRKPVDSRNQLYPRCNHDALVEDETGMQKEVGQQQSKPGLGQRTRSESRFFDGMLEGHETCPSQRLFLDGDDAAMSRFHQKVAAGKAGDEGGGLISNLLADISTAERRHMSRPLEHLPEDVLGALPRPIAINPGDFIDALRKSQ